MRRDASSTESPNAGYPMSAAAGALDVALEKRGHYRLNAAARCPSAADLGGARRLLWAGIGVAIGLAVSKDLLFFYMGPYDNPSEFKK
jgi:adenosylcobinamide-phosphate synthase